MIKGSKEYKEAQAMVEHVQKLHQFRQRDEDAAAKGVTLENFHAYMPQHAYIFAPTREMWPAASVNARIPPVSTHGTASNDHRGQRLARPEPAGRTDDLGAGQADDHRRPAQSPMAAGSSATA